MRFIGSLELSEEVIYHEHINGVAPRSVCINIDGQRIQIIFMKHFSKFFSAHLWNKFMYDFIKAQQVNAPDAFGTSDL